jgi:tetratricopeptide (TPR) repeat protein
LALGEELEAIGKIRNETGAKWLGRFQQGVSRCQLGEFIAARAMLEQCTDLDQPAHRKIRSLGWSADPYLVMLSYLALTLAYLGYIDQARSTMNEALSEARRLQHVNTVVQTLYFASLLDRLTGSPLMHLEELQSLATEHNYLVMLTSALAIRGGSLIALGQAQEGLTLCTQALTKFHAMGHVGGTVRLFASLAVAHASLGHPDEARNCLAEAARIIETTDDRMSEAEVLYQIPGDLLNAAGDQFGAEQRYRQAIGIAERQSAKLLQLRASTSLARLWRDQGRRAEARDLLAPIYGWFTEGFDVPVLKEAKMLLDELATN